MRDDGQVGVVALVGVEERVGDAVEGVAGERWGWVEVFDCCLVHVDWIRDVVWKILLRMRKYGGICFERSKK